MRIGFRKLVTSTLVVGLLGVCGLGGCGPRAGDQKKSHNRVELAKDLLRKHNLQGAESEANEALGLNPRNEEAHHILGLADFLRGVDNYVLLEQQDCVTGIDAEVLREEMDEHFEKADAHFREALALAPSYGEVWANRGLVAMHREEYDKAIEHFEQAFDGRERLGHLGLTRANLGWAKFQSGEYAQAAKQLRQALQFQPKMCIAKYRLGRVYFERREWKKALEQFHSVVQDRTCAMQEAHLYGMRARVELGMTKELDRAERACVALAPKSCMARECRAVMAKYRR